MKNEPVAYRHLHEDGWEYYDAPTGEDCEGCIPLYTHPVKELTDNEVEEIEWVLKKYFNFPTSEKVPNLDKIIKEIIKKAQEK